MAGAAVLSNFARRLKIAWQPLEAALIEINGSLSVEPQFSPPQPEIRVTLLIKASSATHIITRLQRMMPIRIVREYLGCTYIGVADSLRAVPCTRT